MRQEDLMSLLETASRRKGAPLRFDDHLLPPPVASRPIAEEYDPADDPHLFEESLLPDPAYGSHRPRADRNKAVSPGKRPSLSITLDD